MARPPSIEPEKREEYAAKIAAGVETYESASKKIGITRAGAYKILSPAVKRLSNESHGVAAKIEDVADSIKSLPAPLKKNAVGFLETLIAAFDGDFAKYVANNAQISLHTSKLAINRLAKAGANPSPEDLAHVAVLTDIGRKSAEPILKSAQIMQESVRSKQERENSEAGKISKIVLVARDGS